MMPGDFAQELYKTYGYGSVPSVEGWLVCDNRARRVTITAIHQDGWADLMWDAKCHGDNLFPTQPRLEPIKTRYGTTMVWMTGEIPVTSLLYSIQTYRDALNGEGPLARRWANDSHSLAHELCDALDHVVEKLT